jgi:hypothetical protein
MRLVVVSGAIANKLDQGGEAWVRLSYLLGLRRLGFRVHFLEQIAGSACVDAEGAPSPLEDSAQRAYFQGVMNRFGLARDSTLIPTDDQGTALVSDSLCELATSADVLLNISGHLAIEPLLRSFRKKVFLDIDPGFTQFWHATGNAGARLSGHDFYFTIGENVGKPGCSIPHSGINWRPTRPHAVLSEWPLAEKSGPFRFTTIANWRNAYGPVEFGGRTFGLKVHEFRKFLELPARANAEFEIALNIHPADHKDRAALVASGWRLTQPREAAGTPDRFRRYVQDSAAEFSVAQGLYVDTRSGWFSDRTVRYLSSGKPALVQDTGFSQVYPVGAGLVPFRTLDDAVKGAASITADYVGHCQAARKLAEKYFDSDKVLGRLMEEIGVAP